MFVESNVMIIRAITPVHAGNGRALGLIDMPIQKEKHTSIPNIEGSSLKGSLREVCVINKNNELDPNIIFGPENGNESAGLIGFTDAKLLFYPIISINTLFSYVTCPYLINRFLEDMKLSYLKNEKQNGKEKLNKIEIVPQISEGKCIIFNNIGKEDKELAKSVILAEYEFEADNKRNDKYSNFKKLITQNYGIKLKNEMDVVIISNSDFIEMINLTRDIITRNKIDHETGIVAQSGPFTEEYLSAESILYFLALRNGIQIENKEIYINYLKSFPAIVQIGGNATIGKGITEISRFIRKEGEIHNDGN